jgi:MobA/VirD2-like, nuclease domain
MILKASQRGGGSQPAVHLLKTDDNEHVEIHEISGFMSETPLDAFKEAFAISRGTKCKQFLFSLSLSPPEKESVPVEVFEKAIADIENKMGLAGQPRVVVFHEKEGRRHAHCVWSRIDAQKMKAINLPHFKLKLRDISRQLYLDNDWQMPRGLVNSSERNPLNFTQAEWQQAKRIKQDPRAIKSTFQDCWAISDSRKGFANALEERGYYLARGDRRGFVAVDWRGEIYAISKWVGVRTTEIEAKLGKPDTLPSVSETKNRLAENFTQKLKQFSEEELSKHNKTSSELEGKRQSLVAAHRQAREQLRQSQSKRKVQETKVRSVRLPGEA